MTPADGDDPFKIILDKRKRQVIDTLRETPLYCASPVRLSDIVHIVKREHQINIETLLLTETEAGETSTFGVYILRDTLRELPMEGGHA